MTKNYEVLKVRAQVGDDRRTDGLVQVQFLTGGQRLQKALLLLVAWWAAAGASVLLPVVHFVTVPVLFGLGIFFFIRTQTSEGRVLKGEIHCPHCQYKVTIKPQQLNWPVKEICQSCARVLRMDKMK